MSFWFTLLIFCSTSLRLAELISVSPQVTDSRMASWMKTYCSCINQQWQTVCAFSSNTAYRSLHHLHALVSHLVDGSCNVHHLLLLDLVQDIVYADEGTSTSNSSTGPQIHVFNNSMQCIYKINKPNIPGKSTCTCNALVLVPCWFCAGR